MGAARGLGSFRIGLRTLVLTIVMNFCLFHLREKALFCWVLAILYYIYFSLFFSY